MARTYIEGDEARIERTVRELEAERDAIAPLFR